MFFHLMIHDYTFRWHGNKSMCGLENRYWWKLHQWDLKHINYGDVDQHSLPFSLLQWTYDLASQPKDFIVNAILDS
jgi:hypothetical protein